jgi:predicted metal-binding membrane protein
LSQSVSLPRPAAVAIVATLLACAVAAWAVTLAQAGQMAMGGGIAMMSASLFLLTWVVMMIAMMFPTVAPITLAFASVTRSRGEGYLSTAVFIAGYLLVWAAAGLIPLAVMQATNLVWVAPPSWIGRLAGLVIVASGIFQFTPLKDVCLRACRSPLAFVMTHDFGGGARSAMRAGISHGIYCLGCCWALMAVLVVLGLMNLAWMAVIAAVFFIEKNVRFGEVLPKVVGFACIATGLFALLV